MPTIELATKINAPVKRVFDLARSIDAHVESTHETDERAIGGRLTGLIQLNETVTWEAKHFGLKQKMTIQITQMEFPTFFEDKMIRGVFNSMRHEHHFSEENNMTVMKDRFEYKAPFWILGRIVEKLFLTSYMKSFLIKRNEALKELAESGKWQNVLSPS
jgi:ligand-binding SRPBCC domain-containing protein